jgi:hypothetical protein
MKQEEVPSSYVVRQKSFISMCVEAGRSSIFRGVVNRKTVYTTYADGTDRVFRNVHKIQTPGNHPKERIQHSEHSES